MIRYQASPASSTPPPAPPSCRKSLVDRMADDMRELAFSGEGASKETLIARGWSLETIERFGPHARNLARRLSIRRDGTGETRP
ncbi:hypothetical protein [Hoeflea sp.]|uniref:hypothetical protein n=1 Tax=Hoeflea sp. TaxID=1940281 RepID=UPI003B51EF34